MRGEGYLSQPQNKRLHLVDFVCDEECVDQSAEDSNLLKRRETRQEMGGGGRVRWEATFRGMGPLRDVASTAMVENNLGSH